jgi:hypothetical protein
MKMLPEKEEFLKITIRNTLALNPLVSIRKMQELVEHNTGHLMSDKYLARLMQRIRRQAVVESDKKKINERFSEVRERYRVLMEDLSRTIYWKPDFLNQYGIQAPSYKEKIIAIKLLAQLDLALFKTEIDIGVFENKQLIMNEMLQQGVLPYELHEQVVGVFKTWKSVSINQHIKEMNSSLVNKGN